MASGEFRNRRHDRPERTLALVHAIRGAIRIDIDAYNDGYRRFMSCSLHTWPIALHLKHSLNLEKGDSM